MLRIFASTAAAVLVAVAASSASATTLDISGPGLMNQDITSNTTLWSLLGSATVPSDKNAILRYYVIASNTPALNPSFRSERSILISVARTPLLTSRYPAAFFR
jgi:hypothetical protein